MRKQILIAAIFITALTAFAQNPPAYKAPRLKGTNSPDLNGLWQSLNEANWDIQPHAAQPGPAQFGALFAEPAGAGIVEGNELPYQPWALEERNRRRDDANGYEDQVGHCEFYDVGRIHSFTQEYRFSGNTFIINANQHITRIVPMDRKQHLPPGIRLWLGDPIGHWEGDTLVVDSTNFNDKPRMSLGGDFHGADAHIVERFQMPDANTIKWTMTIDNPKVFTRPWTMTSPALMKRLQPAADFDIEDTCHEGNVDLVHLKNTYEKAHGPSWPPKIVR